MGFDGLIYNLPLDVTTDGVNCQLFIDLLGVPHSGLANKDGRRMIICLQRTLLNWPSICQ